VVLAAGRLTPTKDVPTLLRAFARARTVLNARLMILGEGKNAEESAERRLELIALATELGVAEDVSMPGFVDNPFAYMARASVFVLSSLWEGFGNVLVEALACGCPVVSTDSPDGPGEILDRGRYGRLVPVGDHGAMAEAILATLRAPPDPDVLRSRAAMFSVDRAVESYIAALF
jgi:glycosyltransferase involved in cell wall biosynthesis